MSVGGGGESKLGALFQRPFAINRRKKSEAAADSMGDEASSPTDSPSELTKQRVSAAKSYIENMYKAQSQNIQERYARWGAGRRRRPRARGPAAGAPGRVLSLRRHRLSWQGPPRRRGALEEELEREGITEEEKQRIMAELEKRERDYTRLQRQRMCADDFEPLTIIGRGAFGEVGWGLLSGGEGEG
jgi:serine/threonine kinase 38